MILLSSSKAYALIAVILCSMAIPSRAEPLSKKSSRPTKKVTEKGTRKIVWRRNLASALAEGEAAGKAVLADFTAEWCGYCDKLEANTFSDPAVIEMINANFIPVKVNFDSEKAAVAKYEVRGIPDLFFLRPDGNQAHRIHGYVDAETFRAETKKAISKVGDLAAANELAGIKKSFELANHALEAGELGSAYGLFATLASSENKGIPEVKEAMEKVEQITEKGSKSLDEVNKKIATKDYQRVGMLLDELIETYNGAPAADEAKNIQSKLAADPEAKVAMRTAKAERIYKETCKEIEDKNYAIALTRLEEMVKEYRDLPIGRKFLKELEFLQADESIVRAARDDQARTQCTTWMSLARTWAKNANDKRGQEKAKSYYQKVIETFPGTSFAEKAAEEVRRIKQRSS